MGGVLGEKGGLRQEEEKRMGGKGEGRRKRDRGRILWENVKGGRGMRRIIEEEHVGK
jgi:hypothetical protein